VNALISLALRRTLCIADLGLDDSAAPESVRSVCDAIAGNLARRYLSNQLEWAEAAVIANNYFELMINRCGDTVPSYAWDVYLAFDAGECAAPGGDSTTRPMLEALAVTDHAQLAKGSATSTGSNS
jgi:hypothetical protein